jgi:methylmalonyl-CoA/ethylmalonyl-CoA epimerase
MTGLHFHHLGIAVRDLDAAVETYSRLFGYRLLAGPIDDPLQKVRACFIGSDTPGDIMYELVSPLPGADRTPIDRVLDRDNTSYHVCYEAVGIEQTLERLINDGCLRISGPIEAVAFGGRRIAWLLTPTRHLLELLEAPVP